MMMRMRINNNNDNNNNNNNNKCTYVSSKLCAISVFYDDDVLYY